MRRARRSIILLRHAALAAIALMGLCIPARAAAGHTVVEGLAGWEGDSHAQGYGFAGVGVLVPAGSKFVVPFRAIGSYLYYNFDSSGTTTEVRSPGVTLMTGIRVNASRGSFTMLGGGEVRHEHRSTDTPGGTSEDKTTSGVVVQADGDAALGKRWRGFLFANYGGATRYLYGRAALRYQVTNLDWKRPVSFFMGLEGVDQGNDESAALQGGGFAEWNFSRKRVALALHAGYKESWSPGESHRRGPYLGLGIYHRF